MGGGVAVADKPVRLPLRLVAARFAYRLARYPLRDPSLILLVALVTAMWLVLPVMPTATTPSAAPSTTDAAEQYLRALRDRDVAGFLGALSPQARQALEVRSGRTGFGAAAAWFREQESRGERVIGWEYVGAYRTVQGKELRFYVVQHARGDERRDVPYVLTIDGEGKVARVE